MNCPKCGFSQPDDYYCANCGVSISKYVQKKKKTHFFRAIVFLFGIIAVLSLSRYINTARETKRPKPATRDELRQDNVDIRQSSQRGFQAEKSAVRDRNFPSQGEAAHLPRSAAGEETQESAQAGDRGSSAEDLEEFQEGEARKAKTDSDLDDTGLTAMQWFEKGRSLDDDSDAEIQCYQKAIELDPKFAPAYYRLGAIYFRQANYDLAEHQFATFLVRASEADRQTYNIYLYYSPEYLERLQEEIKREEASSKETSKETPAETEKETSEEVDEESSTEVSEEMQTIVKFSGSNGHMVVPVLLNGSLEAKVLFDTGAGITVLSKELAQQLGLEVEGGSPIRLKTIAADVQAPLVTLDSLQFGVLSRKNFPVAVTEFNLGEKREFDGILGMDFLNHYTIQIDSAKNKITLTPKL